MLRLGTQFPSGESAVLDNFPRNKKNFLRIFGMCNNFAYNVMLGAAQDILKRSSGGIADQGNTTDHCVVNLVSLFFCFFFHGETFHKNLNNQNGFTVLALVISPPTKRKEN